jgi:hypothetical protein
VMLGILICRNETLVRLRCGTLKLICATEKVGRLRFGNVLLERLIGGSEMGSPSLERPMGEKTGMLGIGELVVPARFKSPIRPWLDGIR